MGTCIGRDLARRVRQSFPTRLLVVTLLCALALGGASLSGGATPANADNGLSVTKSSDGNPIIGGTIVYTIRVDNTSFAASSTNPDGKATNLDIVDTLPVGATYVSVSPASVGAPKIAQVGQQQQLTFTNVADIARSGSYSLSITASIASVTTPGTTLTNTASASVSNDARVPASIS